MPGKGTPAFLLALLPRPGLSPPAYAGDTTVSNLTSRGPGSQHFPPRGLQTCRASKGTSPSVDSDENSPAGER